MENYIPIFVFGLIVLSIPLIILFLARFFMIKKPSPAKLESYECGNPIKIEAFEYRFSARYIIIAILFVIFDVETIFIYPWAVTFDRLGLFGLIEMIIFLAILMTGYIYAFKEGALKWV